MVWQGYVRALRKRYANVMVISYPSSHVFYEDCTFVPHNLNLINSGFGLGLMSRKKTRALLQEYIGTQLRPDEYDVFFPHDLAGITRRILLKPVFKKLGDQNQSAFDVDVAFHFRDFEREGVIPRAIRMRMRTGCFRCAKIRASRVSASVIPIWRTAQSAARISGPRIWGSL